MTQHDDQHRDIEKGPVGEAPGSPVQRAAVGGDGGDLEPAAERDLWDGRTSWKHHLDTLGLALGGSIIAVIVAIIAPRWLLWVAGGLAALLWIYALARTFYAVYSCRYRLTTQRLFIERGLISRTIDQTELIRVDDVRIRKSLFDRLLGLGSVEVMSTDMSDRQVLLSGIEQPDKIADAIRQHMRRLRRSSLFVENL